MTRFLYRALTALLAVGFVLPLAPTAHAQTLTLAQLEQLAALGPAAPATELASALLPGWHFRGPVASTTGELYWTFGELEAGDLDEPALAWLSLRPMPDGTTDVVVKTTRADLAARLRRELTRRRLVAHPVTSLTGQGVRYDAGALTFAQYEGQKGPYPHCLVVHHTGPAPDFLRARRVARAPALAPADTMAALPRP